jgi:hypothetical protein
VEAIDIAIWCGFVLALALAAFALDELYEWFVEPSRYHTPSSAALPPDPYSSQEEG